MRTSWQLFATSDRTKPVIAAKRETLEYEDVSNCDKLLCEDWKQPVTMSGEMAIAEEGLVG
jgi:hypothetical protein